MPSGPVPASRHSGGSCPLRDLVAYPLGYGALWLLLMDWAEEEHADQAGRAWIEQRIASRLPADRGYVCALEVWTLDALPASRYREQAPWVFDDPGDPLSGT